MRTNEGSEPHTWRQRHAFITVGVCGLVGAATGYALANSIPDGPALRTWVVLLQTAASVAASMAGILVGFLTGFLLVGLGGGGLKCPRCGTLNDDRATACTGCSLSLR